MNTKYFANKRNYNFEINLNLAIFHHLLLISLKIAFIQHIKHSEKRKNIFHNGVFFSMNNFSFQALGMIKKKVYVSIYQSIGN